MKPYRLICIEFALIFLTACTPSEVPPPPIVSSPKVVILEQNFQAAMGQTIYVPIYSHIYYENRQKYFDLAATLSIRNTDLTNPMIVTAVRYYDSNGKLIRQYIERPIQLDALASTNFVVDRNDTSGGSGANFIVEWVAKTDISEPIVEAVMIGSALQQGISWISPGKVIINQTTPQKSPI
ncbi:DUF3124 domain-containing protein [Chlorogloea sp. CCALA 695]|uniref:DUF3124 domain-containing protein n=1 Tax=Chlorogloea sp. CCALA 695 TaxID=2107693 RepID=UPI000D053C06|nr:DUF3124 domain-containing protein [Chlorogloea sp. CCALA 695]PSB31521.1 hypothetical protein C7B70_12655 [Chlorogloea sp. CCALA 695]